jgi:hypothetical protein
MPPRTFWNISKNPQRHNQVDFIGQRIGRAGDFTAVIDFALAYTVAALSALGGKDADDPIPAQGDTGEEQTVRPSKCNQQLGQET